MIKDASKALRPILLPDFLFCHRYSVAPYRGCAHGCRYCDGRAEKYYVEGDFENDIIVRKNIPGLLVREIKKVRERGIISLGSGTSDSWQPAEIEHKLTREILKVLSDGIQPVKLITKSDLILRDLEILLQIHKKNGLLVFITVTSINDEVRSIFEPGAASIESRMAVIQALTSAGLNVIALVMPLLPGISDSQEEINALYERLKKAGVKALIPGHLTLRPGRQKDLFFQTIKTYYSGLEDFYHGIFKEERLSGNPVYSYQSDLYKKIMIAAKEFQLPFLVPHVLFSPLVSRCDEILILMEQMERVYSARGVNIQSLHKSSLKYREWLTGLRRDFNRKRTLPSGYPDEVLADFISSGNFHSLIDNEKLAGYLEKVNREGLKWDSVTCKWQ